MYFLSTHTQYLNKIILRVLETNRKKCIGKKVFVQGTRYLNDIMLQSILRYAVQQQNTYQNKKPKKRRFHPLRGLRKIFRRKSRGAADARLVTGHVDHRDTELVRLPREDITDRHPAGRPEEARSRSASELLTDSSDRERISDKNYKLEGFNLYKKRTRTDENNFNKDSVMILTKRVLMYKYSNYSDNKISTIDENV
ncbi:hypothetical protein WN51_04941 [Melipona quadrifasciata]|uniref:Uncharacterized protein n=1 Tax=Melipona quadrifasciata TaxID=166423 RepID=A0A0M8ZUB4_9HYME|nr:hypothetical protein WN51_04941 [Melipona quadrifasciata]